MPPKERYGFLTRDPCDILYSLETPIFLSCHCLTDLLVSIGPPNPHSPIPGFPPQSFKFLRPSDPNAKGYCRFRPTWGYLTGALGQRLPSSFPTRSLPCGVPSLLPGPRELGIADWEASNNIEALLKACLAPGALASMRCRLPRYAGEMC